MRVQLHRRAYAVIVINEPIRQHAITVVLQHYDHCALGIRVCPVKQQVTSQARPVTYTQMGTRLIFIPRHSLNQLRYYPSSHWLTHSPSLLRVDYMKTLPGTRLVVRIHDNSCEVCLNCDREQTKRINLIMIAQ